MVCTGVQYRIMLTLYQINIPILTMQACHLRYYLVNLLVENTSVLTLVTTSPMFDRLTLLMAVLNIGLSHSKGNVYLS